MPSGSSCSSADRAVAVQQRLQRRALEVLEQQMRERAVGRRRRSRARRRGGRSAPAARPRGRGRAARAGSLGLVGPQHLRHEHGEPVVVPHEEDLEALPAADAGAGRCARGRSRRPRRAPTSAASGVRAPTAAARPPSTCPPTVSRPGRGAISLRRRRPRRRPRPARPSSWPAWRRAGRRPCSALSGGAGAIQSSARRARARATAATAASDLVERPLDRPRARGRRSSARKARAMRWWSGRVEGGGVAHENGLGAWFPAKRASQSRRFGARGAPAPAESCARSGADRGERALEALGEPDLRLPAQDLARQRGIDGAADRPRRGAPGRARARTGAVAERAQRVRELDHGRLGARSRRCKRPSQSEAAAARLARHDVADVDVVARLQAVAERDRRAALERACRRRSPPRRPRRAGPGAGRRRSRSAARPPRARSSRP